MRDVDGDGNCLFRSIADQIEGVEANHRKYRDMGVQHMKDNKDFFKFFLDEKEDFDKYLKDMDENGTWGGHFELVALSAVLGVNFVLHMKDKDPYLITAGAKYNKSIKTYHLAYHIDEHYSSVRKLGDEGFNPAEEIVLDFKFVAENEDESSTDEDENGKVKVEQIVVFPEEEVTEEERILESIGIPSFDSVYEEMWLSGWNGKIEVKGLCIDVVDTPVDKGVDNDASKGNGNDAGSVSNDNGMIGNSDNGVINSNVPVKTPKGWSKVKKKKVGPNDPCPCHSGQKLKKCCKVA